LRDEGAGPRRGGAYPLGQQAQVPGEAFAEGLRPSAAGGVWLTVLIYFAVLRITFLGTWVWTQIFTHCAWLDSVLRGPPARHVKAWTPILVVPLWATYLGLLLFQVMILRISGV
jgi:hypothetical protein